MALSGFLFLFIIVTNITSHRFGYVTMNDLNSEAKLQEISRNPKAFKVSVALILTEHASIIALAVMLLLAFGTYSAILAVVWTVSRIGEGSVQIYYKKNYWGLLDIARQYPDSSGAEKSTLVDAGRRILETKDTVFKRTQILFSIGTLAYSILFVTYGVVPEIIGWLGIAAGTLYGFGNGMTLLRPDFKAVWNIGGLLVLIFEIILGGWLLLQTLF
jgi:hypothetical protein